MGVTDGMGQLTQGRRGAGLSIDHPSAALWVLPVPYCWTVCNISAVCSVLLGPMGRLQPVGCRGTSARPQALCQFSEQALANT